jgi:hypothetical protein
MKTPQLYSFGWPYAPRFVAPVWLRFTPRSPGSCRGLASLLNDESRQMTGRCAAPKDQVWNNRSQSVRLSLSATLGQGFLRHGPLSRQARSARGCGRTTALDEAGIDDKHPITH